MAEAMEALPSVAHSAQQVSDPEEVRTRQCGWLLKRSGGHSSNSAKSASRMLSFGSIAKKWDTRFVQVVPGAVVWGAERAELADDAGAKRFELAGCRLEMRSEAKASLKGWLPRFKLVHPDRTLTFEVPSGGVELALLKEALAAWSSVLLAAIKSADAAQEAAERAGEGGAALDAAVPSSDDGEGEGEDAPVALPGPSIPPLAIQGRKRFESQDFGAHSSDEECVSPDTRQRSLVLSRWLCRCATSAWLGLQCAAPSRVPSASVPPRTHACGLMRSALLRYVQATDERAPDRFESMHSSADLLDKQLAMFQVDMNTPRTSAVSSAASSPIRTQASSPARSMPGSDDDGLVGRLKEMYAQHEAEAEADQAAFAVGGGGDVAEVEALRAEVARLKAAAAAAGSP